MVSDLNIGIVGGSIGGMAAAATLTRAGYQVTVFERSPGQLAERGGGIGIPLDVLADLKSRDLVDANASGVRGSERTWTVKDGDNYLGRVLAHQPMSLDAQHWGLLYQQVRARASKATYVAGVSVDHVEDQPEGADIVVSDGTHHHFDLVIGADGYRSKTRLSIFPDAVPAYAGYPGWRGVIEESDNIIEDIAPVTDEMQSVGTTRGHCISYFVPGKNGEVTEGHRRLNWLWYDAGVTDELMGVTRDEKGRAIVEGTAPGELTPEQLDYLYRIADEQLPPWHANLVKSTPQPFMQPMFDLEPESYVSGHVVLVGDAASVARPHTGTGTTKAIHDAIALAGALSDGASLAEALADYDAERSAAGRQFVQLGRRLGIEQVNEAPDWSKFTPESLTEWLNTMTISKVYAWGDAHR